MPCDHDIYDDYEDDGYTEIEEDDRDATYYEFMWGGPDDKEVEEWYEAHVHDEKNYDRDFDPFAPPLPAPQPGDEAAAHQHFAALKRKYQAESFQEVSALSPLYKILLKLESKEQMDHADLSWLRKNRLRGPILIFATRAALGCETRLKETGDLWEAVRASSFWRMADRPAKALSVTEGLADKPGASNSRLKAAIYMTRGGALRDQGQLDDAEACRQQAIQLNQESFHPYMLLGAIYYQKACPQKGDEQFATALKLGAKPELQDREIMKAVGQAGEDEQGIIAQYLLQKDPVKYRWARKYLQ
jgi:hypothetical protein